MSDDVKTSEEKLDTEFLDNLKEDDDVVFDQKVIDEVENTETPPSPTDEEWHDYVIRQFRDDEMDNGSPRRDGLVRVAEKVIGPIVKRNIVSYTGPTKDNLGNVMVHIRLELLVDNPQHPLNGHIISEDGLAEVNDDNTPAPFKFHAGATASSKAEAQALRKILRLRNTVAADEKAPEDSIGLGSVFVPDEPLDQEHINVIDLLCRRLKVNVLKFVNAGEHKYPFIEAVSMRKGKEMIKHLTKWQSEKGEFTIPANLAGYDPQWREENRKNRDEPL